MVDRIAGTLILLAAGGIAAGVGCWEKEFWGCQSAPAAQCINHAGMFVCEEGAIPIGGPTGYPGVFQRAKVCHTINPGPAASELAPCGGNPPHTGWLKVADVPCGTNGAMCCWYDPDNPLTFVTPYPEKTNRINIATGVRRPCAPPPPEE